MSKIKTLAFETIFYGASTILVRFLNWMLMPYYIRSMSTTDYGSITYFYSIISILLVILTFGMETGFFKFAKSHNYKDVLSTSLSSVGIVSLVFLTLGTVFITPIQSILDVQVSKGLIFINILCLAVDAFSSIIFAKLRYENKLSKYLYLRVLNVVVGLGFTFFYLGLAVKLHTSSYSYLVDWFFIPNQAVYYAFLANLIGSLAVLLFIYKDLAFQRRFIDFSLLKKMLSFSLPMLGVGITGMINMNLDKILLPRLLTGDHVLQDLAIYGANFKIGVLMAMFAQSFRMAFEPFCFKYADSQDIKHVYADVLKFFTIFGVFIFLLVLFYIDIINYSLTKEYLIGNSIIPIVLLAQLFSGMFYSQSLWYKLSDKAIFGLYLGVFGALVTISVNLLFVPSFGFIASAWSGLLCFFSMVILSYFLGQKFFPIPYDVKSISLYLCIGLVFYALSFLYKSNSMALRLFINTFFLFSFLGLVYWKEGLHLLILKYVGKNSNN